MSSVQASAFHEDAARYIEQKSVGKDFVFIADTNHYTKDIFRFAFSKSLLMTFHRLGIKHVMLEVGSVENQCYLNAVAAGRLTPSQFAQLQDVFVAGTRVTSQEISLSHDRCVGQGAQLSISLGIKFHFVEGNEGLVKPQDFKKYTFAKKQIAAGWLEFLKNNHDFFDQPKKLLDKIVVNNKDRYARKKLDLPGWIRSMSDLSSQEAIYEYWKFDTKNNYIDVSHLYNDKKALALSSHSLDDKSYNEFIDSRTSSDSIVFNRMNEFCHGEKSAVIYGLGHFRHRVGGFAESLHCDRYSMFSIVDDDNPKSLLEFVVAEGFYKPLDDDHLILLKQRQLSTIADFTPAEDSIPRGQMRVSTRPWP